MLVVEDGHHVCYNDEECFRWCLEQRPVGSELVKHRRGQARRGWCSAFTRYAEAPRRMADAISAGSSK